MASAFERGVEEGVDNSEGGHGVDKAGGHDKNIGVVMLTRQSGYFLVPAESGADALMFVESHGDSVAGAAHGDSHRTFAALDGSGCGMGEVGVVTRFGRVGAEILVGDSAGFEIAFYDGFQLETGVV